MRPRPVYLQITEIFMSTVATIILVVGSVAVIEAVFTLTENALRRTGRRLTRKTSPTGQHTA